MEGARCRETETLYRSRYIEQSRPMSYPNSSSKFNSTLANDGLHGGLSYLLVCRQQA